MRELFMAYTEVFGDFYNRPQNLKNILKIKDDVQFRSRLWQAHQANKKRLEDMFHSWRIKSDVFTLGWARRIAAYKRPSLIFQDPKRLLDICKRIGPIQIIIAGKAHPNDNLVGTYINEIMNTIDALHEEFRYVRIIMLENYDTYFGQLLTSCVDVWLNNPLPPFEASGTSGMKAILNGVIQLSTVDGWIGEADFENMGEVFGYRYKESGPIGSELDLRLKEDSAALYEALERLITLYYQLYKRGEFQSSCRWIDLMIHCIKEASIFNTHRMLKDYERLVWNLDHA
jgi:starch phosphorylase